jgi:hypothetical protein
LENLKVVYTLVDSEGVSGDRYSMTLPMILEYINTDRNPDWEDYDETDWREGLAEFTTLKIVETEKGLNV